MMKIRLFNSQTPTEVKEVNVSLETMVNKEVLIGRNPNCALVLDGAEVSRMHGKISLENDTYYYTDLNSSGGTWINNSRAAVNQGCILKGGDIIKIGEYVLMVAGLDSEEGATLFLQEQTEKTVIQTTEKSNLTVTEQKTIIDSHANSNRASDLNESPWQEKIAKLHTVANPVAPGNGGHNIEGERSLQPLTATKKTGALAIDVVATVFSKVVVSNGETFFIQVFVHRAEQDELVNQLAVEFDPEAVRRGFRSLETEIEPGSRLTIDLVMPEMQIDSSLEKITWRDRPYPVQFVVTVPQAMPPRNLIGTVTITQNGENIGQVKFKITKG